MVVVILSSASARAQLMHCDDLEKLQGAVQHLILYEGSLRNPANLRPRDEVTFTADRRKATMTDNPPSLYVTTCEFDANGRVVRDATTWGARAVSEKTHTYDSRGRRLRTTWTSAQGNTVITHNYDDNEYTDREVWSASVMTMTTMRQMDSQGRILKEVQTRTDAAAPTTREYKYDGSTTQMCWVEPQDRGCSTKQVDNHGNEIEGTVSNTTLPPSSATHRYVYDSRGNWTRHELQGSSAGLLWTRMISYW